MSSVVIIEGDTATFRPFDKAELVALCNVMRRTQALKFAALSGFVVRGGTRTFLGGNAVDQES